jgi:hypothetical protein
MRKVFVSTLCLLVMGCGASPNLTTPAPFKTKQALALATGLTSPYGPLGALGACGGIPGLCGAGLGAFGIGMLPPTFTYGVDYGYPFVGATCAGSAFSNAIGLGCGFGATGLTIPFDGFGYGTYALPGAGLGCGAGLGFGGIGGFGGIAPGFAPGVAAGVAARRRDAKVSRLPAVNNLAFRPAGSRIWQRK